MSAMTPPELVPDIFGAGVFEEDFERILAVMRETNPMEINAKEHMQGIMRQIATSERDHYRIRGLKTYLTEIDRRRGTRWQDLFPWLEDLAV
jgi:hypothetical protein